MEGFMTDQNKSQESEQKWSRLRLGPDSRTIIFDGGKFFAAAFFPEDAARILECVIFCAGSDLKTELEFGPKTYREAVQLLRSAIAQLTTENEALKENKSAAEKLCDGVCFETLTLLNQSGHPTLTQICEENQALRKLLTNEPLAAEVQKLQSELEQLKAERDRLAKEADFFKRFREKFEEHGSLCQQPLCKLPRLKGEGLCWMHFDEEDYFEDLRAQLSQVQAAGKPTES